MHRSLLIVCILLNSVVTFSQQDTYKFISSSLLPEKIYLHVDRDIFNSGDDIWFKAYITDFLMNEPSTNTNNLHVDLITPDSRILQHKIIRITDGLGNGDFKLNDSLPSGRYLIRAYPNFMRNFGNEFFFNKEIVVINSSGNPIKDTTRYLQDRLYVDFFPEGGSLVDDVTSLIAFKATNSLGKGVDVRGKVFSESGEYISGIESNHLGMGFFLHKPASGTEYYLLAESPDNKSVRIDLPQSFPSGVVIHTFNLSHNKLLLKLLTNEKFLASFLNKDLRLTVSIRNLYTTFLDLKITSIVNNFMIPLDDFPEGVLKLTLSDPGGKPLAERLVFNNKNHEAKLSISTNQKVYKPREPVTANLTLSGDSASKAYLSLSVSDAGMSLDTSYYASNIASWFLLESDVRGQVENPGLYFDPANDERLGQLDLLLLTQGWRDFAWKYDKAKIFENENGFSLKGRVAKTINGKPFPHAKLNIAVFDEKKAVFLTDKADSSGYFTVDNLDIAGIARILVSCADKKNNLTGWIYIDSMYYEPPEALFLPKPAFELMPVRFMHFYEENRNTELYGKKFKLGDTLRVGEVTVSARKIERPIEMSLKSSRAQYGKPDKEFILTQKYNDYPGLSQVLVGKIPGVEVNTVSNMIRIRGQNPLILVDGIPSHDIPIEGNIPPISPSVIDRVDILYWSSPFGSRGANGVINIITKRGDYNYEALNIPHSKYTFCKGFDEPRIFYSPRHETKFSEGQTPDYRNTLHWQPNIELDPDSTASVNYYNSDKEATFSIKVEGITDDGIPVTGCIHYKVKK